MGGKKEEWVMALSRPRKLDLDGVRYHWKASRNGVLHFAVRQPSNSKRRMVVNFLPEAEVTITPGLVKHYINRALTEGWKGSKTYEHSVDTDR
jgi:hypothetical protein